MPTTMDLLKKAENLKKSDAEWCRELGINRTAFGVARTKQHLSPVIAGALAEKLGEDAKNWIVIAALETAKPNAFTKRVISEVRTGFKF